MKISIKESTIVRPSKETPNHRLWLSNLDLLQARIHLPTLFFYKPVPDDDHGSSNFFDTTVLKEALSNALVPFYPMAGRMARDQNGRIEINCNGDGVLFVHAQTDSSLTDLNDFTPSSQLLSLLPKVDYSSHISSYPFFITQITKFSCGGVTLGIGIHHTVADGNAYAHFINTWSDLARGLPMTAQPFFQRTILRARDPPNPAFHHNEYDPLPPVNTETQLFQPTSTVIMKIPLGMITALKAKVNINEENRANYSTYEILCAHIWRSTCKARNLLGDQSTMLSMPVDGRSRLRPSLPKGYFGNVLFHATPIALSGELVSESLVKSVERIHKGIEQMQDDDYLRSAIDYLEEPLSEPDAVMQVRAMACRFPDMKIVSWMRLYLDQPDFGWGKPVFLRKVKLHDGLCYILPSFNGDGNLSLAICLQEHHMKSFGKFFYELNY